MTGQIAEKRFKSHGRNKMSRYIDADAFAEKMKRQYCERCDNYHGIRCKSCSCGDWLDDLDSEPTADVRENVKGEWLIRKDTTECSNCHTKWRDYRGLISTFYFCPDCGADMRGEA